MWKIVFRQRFVTWLEEQSADLRRDVYASLSLLREEGPLLSRPYADTLKGSRLPNLKELRTQHQGHPIRTFFAFDPIRRAIVLCAGDKTGDKRFYEKLIPIAEDEFLQHIAEMKHEN